MLMGGRMGRYTGSPDTLVCDQRIDLRGFSAGSFAGLSTLHLLWKIPNVEQLPVLRNCSSLLRRITPYTYCTMRRISYVCGSLGSINWTSSGSGTHMSPRRALLIESTLEPRSIITPIGYVLIIRQGGWILPGSSS